jgi:hypothetical protein
MDLGLRGSDGFQRANPYNGSVYIGPGTPALLRLDPIWDPLRADPAFQKLCEEKQH